MRPTPREASESGETGEPGEEEGVSLYEKWEQSLLYGIDTSVTATIDEMIDAKDDEFEDEVLELLGSRRSILRNKALDFFEALESNRAIETVLGELNFYQDLNSSFVVRMINHLQRREQPSMRIYGTCFAKSSMRKAEMSSSPR
jgi:hypothetical protein